MGLKRNGYKTRGGAGGNLEKKSSMPHGINISWHRQVGPRLLVQAPVMERSLPTTQWLPALGGENVPSAPLPSFMEHVPVLCNDEVWKSLHASKTIILQHLCFEPGCA